MSERRISLALGDINVVERAMYRLSDAEWVQSLQLVREAITTLEQKGFFAIQDRLHSQIHVLSQVQAISYRDPDLGAIGDISSWCLEKWLMLLCDHPYDVEILKGE
jgi:hypothetical protein